MCIRDSLKLDDQRIAAMAKGLREVAALADPVGRILDERVRPNGLKLQKISTPIGVVVIIYESRPNVTADAASLCFKSGNATILRGGKEALNSNQTIARIMIEAGKQALAKFPEHAIQLVPVADREAIPILLSLTQYIDPVSYTHLNPAAQSKKSRANSVWTPAASSSSRRTKTRSADVYKRQPTMLSPSPFILRQPMRMGYMICISGPISPIIRIGRGGCGMVRGKRIWW